MTIYSQTKEIYKGLPYTFRCRVFGKYDKEFIETSPNRVNKSYTDLTDYDGLHYTTEIKNNVNITRCGNPTTTDDGIISGFNADTFGKYIFNIENITTPFEIYLSFVVTSTGNNNIILSNQTTGASPIRSDSLRLASWSSSVTGGTYMLTANTLCDVKGVSDGTTWYLYGKLHTDSEWTLSYSCDIGYMFTEGNNELIFGRNTSTYSSQCLSGQIYLNKSYIRVSSQDSPDVWNTAWTGTTEQFKVYDFSQTILPWKWEYQNKLQVSRYCLSSTEQSKTYYSNQINGTVTGTLTTNSSRAMSGFSGSNYLKLPNAFMPASNTWEIVWKMRTTTLGSQQYFYGSSTDYFRTVGGELDSSNKFGSGISSNGTSWDIAWLSGKTTWEANTWYWVKISFTGTMYKLELSTDGKNWNLENSIESSTPIYQDSSKSIMHLGTMGSRGTYWHGDIDLGESYIKIGDSIWWRGMNKETVPSMSYGKTIGTTNNVYVINGYESLSAEASSQPLDTSATNPRYLGEVDVLA